MRTENPPLPPGYSPLAPGQIATLVTCLEMTERPRPRPAPAPGPDVRLTHVATPDIPAYRRLFRRVGQDWLWGSRLAMSDDELRAALAPPDVELHVLARSSEPIGLYELDFRQPGECELVFFGLVPEAVGRGLGRHLMANAVERAWSRPIRRLWLHTCTFDHPSALAFYRRSGFEPYMLAVEVLDDPRLTGDLPADVAPQVPRLARA